MERNKWASGSLPPAEELSREKEMVLMTRANSPQGSSPSRRWVSQALFAMALSWNAALLGQNQEVLRNADIVTMATARLAPETIVLKIETSVCQFDTSPDALAVLKAAGVPDLAISAMLKASAGTKNSPTPATTTPPSPSSPAASPSSPGASPSSPVAAGKDPAKATVYVYRPGKFFGKALEPSVFLDERKLLDMDNGRYLAIKLEPGRHVLRSNEKDSEIDQAWEAGQTYYVKITIAAGMMKGHGLMGMVTEKLALKEMQKLRPLNKDNVEPEHLAVVDFAPVK
jgi:hypothetical protein